MFGKLGQEEGLSGTLYTTFITRSYNKTDKILLYEK